MAHLLWLWARRPAVTSVRAKGQGLVLTLEVPSQVIPTLVVFGELLEPELGLLRSRLWSGAVAVDVGASVGTWCMVAARVGARVLALEPDVDNLRTLHHNLRANDLEERVTVRQLAVGRRATSAVVHRSQNRYLNQVHEAQDGSDGDRVDMLTLAEVLELARLPIVDVLKVNTAGHEADVFAGAQECFRQGRIVLAQFLDGVALRAAVQAAQADGTLSQYRLAAYDGDRDALVHFPDLASFGVCRLSPMNHYLILEKCDRTSGVDGSTRRPPMPR